MKRIVSKTLVLVMSVHMMASLSFKLNFKINPATKDQFISGEAREPAEEIVFKYKDKDGDQEKKFPAKEVLEKLFVLNLEKLPVMNQEKCPKFDSCHFYGINRSRSYVSMDDGSSRSTILGKAEYQPTENANRQDQIPNVNVVAPNLLSNDDNNSNMPPNGETDSSNPVNNDLQQLAPLDERDIPPPDNGNDQTQNLAENQVQTIANPDLHPEPMGNAVDHQQAESSTLNIPAVSQYTKDLCPKMNLVYTKSNKTIIFNTPYDKIDKTSVGPAYDCLAKLPKDGKIPAMVHAMLKHDRGADMVTAFSEQPIELDMKNGELDLGTIREKDSETVKEIDMSKFDQQNYFDKMPNPTISLGHVLLYCENKELRILVAFNFVPNTQVAKELRI